VSFFVPQATGGQVAAKINHQVAVAAVLGIELLIEPAALHPEGTAIAFWVLTLEQVNDVAVTFGDGAVTSVQVKDQKLGRSDVDQIVDNWLKAPGSPTSKALRICALQGLTNELATLPTDLMSLHMRAIAASRSELDEAREDLRTKFRLRSAIDELVQFELRSLHLDGDGRLHFADALRRLDDTRLISRTTSDVAFDRLVVALLPMLLKRGKLTVGEFRQTLDRSLIYRVPLDGLDYYVHSDPNNSQGGYRIDEKALEQLNQDRRLVEQVARESFRRWRRAHTPEVLKSMLLGPIKCPECGHPMMANWYGLRFGHGPACGRCGFTRYVTLIVACDCGRGVAVKEQPELSMEALGTAVTRFVSTGGRCSHCEQLIPMEKARTRWFVLPLPASMVR
jgi:hypothetical protein